jgi:hypothetical protein
VPRPDSRYGRCLILLLALALAVGVTPRGYMPGSGTWIALCSELGGDREVWVDFGEEPDRHADTQECPWAQAGSAVLPQPAPTLAAFPALPQWREPSPPVSLTAFLAVFQARAPPPIGV